MNAEQRQEDLDSQDGGQTTESKSASEKKKSQSAGVKMKSQIPAAPKSVKSKDLSPLERQRMEAARMNAIALYRQQKQQQMQERRNAR